MFLDVCPFEKEIATVIDPDTPLSVDVGESIGHQSAALEARLPNVSGRVVLQDVPPVIVKT